VLKNKKKLWCIFHDIFYYLSHRNGFLIFEQRLFGAKLLKPKKFVYIDFALYRVVSEISTLILTGNRTHQKEQVFSLPFWRKTLRSGLKK
jgi:hypothetical protein